MASFGLIFAQNHDNSKVAEVPHDAILDIEYQIRDFNNTKESGSYDFGVNKTSFAGDNKFHIGSDFHWDLNAGIVDDFSMIFELGPSGRMDISNNCFINAPLNVICQV